MEMLQSPEAATALKMVIEEGDFTEADEHMGVTDCPEGCEVEPDGHCPHGYLSAGITLGVI